MKRFLVALLAAALPHALSAQGVAVGASGAVLTTTRTLQGEPGGGVVGITGQLELLASRRAGGRVDATMFDAAVFAGIHGIWHALDAARSLDPFAFAGGTLQFPTGDAGDGAGSGLVVGIGANVRPARSPVGLALELRFHQLFRNAYPLDPTSLVQVNLGLRLLRR
jgi:hypothetical protein